MIMIMYIWNQARRQGPQKKTECLGRGPDIEEIFYIFYIFSYFLMVRFSPGPSCLRSGGPEGFSPMYANLFGCTSKIPVQAPIFRGECEVVSAVFLIEKYFLLKKARRRRRFLGGSVR